MSGGQDEVLSQNMALIRDHSAQTGEVVDER